MRKQHYRTLEDLLLFIEGPNQAACRRLLKENRERFERAWGSSHNHQAWLGGYLDHVTEVLNTALLLYETMDAQRRLPFTFGDAVLVLYLHDVEKPWKGEVKFADKVARRAFRRQLLIEHGIVLTAEQQNALRYVEGEGDDYSGQRRVMNELAAFCHICDVASARIWFNHPWTNQADPWPGARRHSGE